MSEPTILPLPSAKKDARARELDMVARALLATAATRAFESGRVFNEIAEGQLFLALGCSSFEEYLASLEAAGFKRATIYSNMRLAQKFDQERHRHVGVGRLRLLAADYVPDPVKLLEEGIEVPDGKGGTVRRAIKEMTCRNLGTALRKHYAPQSGPRTRRKCATPQPDPLVARAEAAVAPLLAVAGDAEDRESHGSAANESTQPTLPLPPTASPQGTVDLDGPFIDDEEAYATATVVRPGTRVTSEKRGGMPRARSA